MSTSVTNTQSSSSSLIASLGAANRTDAQKASADEMQTRFLNLLVTQLKNQDPLNPMDNNQMTTQLSQISTVSGIEKLNATMEKLLANYSGSQTMQAAAMIGKTVLTAGSGMALTDKGAVAGVTLDGAADKVSITIKNAAGNVVQTQQLGAHPAGTFSFTWDGKSDAGVAQAAGAYTFSVTAVRGGETVKSASLQAGTVNAVTLANDGLSLQLGSNKTVGYGDVKQILN